MNGEGVMYVFPDTGPEYELLVFAPVGKVELCPPERNPPKVWLNPEYEPPSKPDFGSPPPPGPAKVELGIPFPGTPPPPGPAKEGPINPPAPGTPPPPGPEKLLPGIPTPGTPV